MKVDKVDLKKPSLPTSIPSPATGNQDSGLETHYVPATAKQDSGLETHYVLVIHGTFSAIEPGKIKWFQLDEHNLGNFCNQLNLRLARTPLGRAVWRSFDPKQVFSWSGENGHAQRLEAAKTLCGKIIELVNRDPTARIHLVAHSHGGNVALKAIELYHDSLYESAYRLLAQVQRIMIAGEGKGGDPIDEAFRQVFPKLTPGPPEPWKELLREPWELLREPREELLREPWELLREPREELLRGVKQTLTLGLPFGTGDPLGRLRRILPADEAREFARIWVNSRASNRLGRVVFLGTPFFRKQWMISKKVAARVLDDILRNLRVLPFIIIRFMIIIYFFILYIYYVCLYTAWIIGFRLGLWSWPPSLHWNPTVWPTWLLGLWLLVSILITFLEEYKTDKYYNTNVYFDLRRLGGQIRQCYSSQVLDLRLRAMGDGLIPSLIAWGKSLLTGNVATVSMQGTIPKFVLSAWQMKPRRIPALVVTAHYLDEALLGLSSEPMVYANLVPGIEEQLYPLRELRALRAFREAPSGGLDLRLMSSLNDVSAIPTEGKDLIIVAEVDNVLHFRIFDSNRKRVVDTYERRLTEKDRQIKDLRKQLESLWPLHELTRSDKDQVTKAVTSIVGHTPSGRWGAMWKAFWATPGSDVGEGAPTNPIGLNIESLSLFDRGSSRRIADWIIRQVWNVAYVAVWPLSKPVRLWLERYLTRTLLKAVSSAAFGLPANEVQRARVDVRDRLDLPEVFDETYRDVAEEVLRREREETPTGPVPRPEAVGTGGRRRYAHLVDPAELKRKRAERESAPGENAWKRISRSSPVLYRRYQDALALEPTGADRPPADKLTREQYEDQLALAWFTLEERAKEAFGAVELIHSLYYTNPAVIDMISEFLAKDGTGE